MALIPTTEPLEVRAGLTWAWTRADSDYPADQGWVLTYWFKQLAAAGSKFSIAAAADGAAHAVNVSAATTTAYTAGDYSWAAIVTKGAEAHEVDAGTLKVLPRYDADAALDDRSHARKVLDALNSLIEGKATADVASYSIGTRELTKLKPEELLVWRDRYAVMVSREERAKSGQGGAKIVVRL